MKLTLVTPEKRVLIAQEVTEVTVPAHRGELNILPGHQPMITTLTPGVLRYKIAGAGEVAASISWGYCNISPEGINVLAETVETASEIDYSLCEADLEAAEKQMASETMDDQSWKKLQEKVAHAKAKLQMRSHSKH
jgi:F-type H+-transporting ATPase subunit epsilon